MKLRAFLPFAIAATAAAQLPQLDISKLPGGQFQLAWPATFNGWEMEQSADLLTWAAAADYPLYESSTYLHRVALPGSAAFFRLRETTPLDFAVPVAPGAHTNLALVNQGRVRGYQLFIPPGYTAAGAPGLLPVGGAPLLVVFHGSGQSASTFVNGHPDLLTKCAAEGWLLAVPDGTVNLISGARGWAPGGWLGHQGNVDDVEFALALVAHLATTLKIDERRVFAAGFSNGGTFTHSLHAMTAGVFAATASVASTCAKYDDPTANFFYPPIPVEPRPIMVANSRLDDVRPFNGGVNTGGVPHRAAIDAANWWNYRKGMFAVAPAVVSGMPASLTQANAAYNSAHPSVRPADPSALLGNSVVTHTWSTPGPVTKFVELTLPGHVWPDAADDVNWDANHEVVEFFKANPRTTPADAGGYAAVPVPASWVATTLAGTPVIYHVPATSAPTGLIVVCHPAGSDENFARHPELVEILGELANEGFAFIATRSTGAAWDTANPLATNADIARCVAVRDALVALSPTLLPTTPVLTCGYENGAQFALLLAGETGARGAATYSLDTRTPLPPLVAAALEGGTFNVWFGAAENDTSDPALIARQFVTAQLRELGQGEDEPIFHITAERGFHGDRLRRIPGVTASMASNTAAQLVALGHMDATGQRLRSAAALAAALPTMVLPPALGALDAAVRDELSAVWCLGFPGADTRYALRDFFLEASCAGPDAPTPPPLAAAADPGPFAPVPEPEWNGAFSVVGPWTSGPSNTFEGFKTLYHVPLNPQGLVYFFHGTGGNATIADHFDERVFINDLVARGFAVVSSESTDRTGTYEREAQWDQRALNDDGTLFTGNVDYQRMKRFRDWLIANTDPVTGVKATTKVFAFGFSNGGEMGIAFAHLALADGIPFTALGLHAPGSSEAPVRRILRRLPSAMPIFLTVLGNDNRVTRIAERKDELVALGFPVTWRVSAERVLSPQRFTRIPGVTPAQSQSIFDSLVSANIVSPAGLRLDPVDVFTTRLGPFNYPGPHDQDANQQLRITGALHHVSAEFAAEQNALFDAYAP